MYCVIKKINVLDGCIIHLPNFFELSFIIIIIIIIVYQFFQLLSIKCVFKKFT